MIDDIHDLVFISKDDLIEKLHELLGAALNTETTMRNIQNRMANSNFDDALINDVVSYYNQFRDISTVLEMFKYACVKHGLIEQHNVLSNYFNLFSENNMLLLCSILEPVDIALNTINKTQINRLMKYSKKFTKDLTAASKQLSNLKF